MARAKSRKEFKGKTREEALEYIKYITGKINELDKKHSKMMGMNSSSVVGETLYLGKKLSTKRAESLDTLGGLTRTNKEGRVVLSATKKLENLSDKDLLIYAKGLSEVVNRERYSSQKAFKTFITNRLDKSIDTLCRNNGKTLAELKVQLGDKYYAFCQDVFSSSSSQGWSSDSAFNGSLQTYSEYFDEAFNETVNKYMENIEEERKLALRGKAVR